jgi:hypothetical protein
MIADLFHYMSTLDEGPTLALNQSELLQTDLKLKGHPPRSQQYGDDGRELPCG